MTASGRDGWDRVERHFAELLERSPAERASALERWASEDPGLAEELRSLLEAHGREGPVDAPPASLIGHVADELTRGLSAGERVGPFRVTREIGHGGMGHVYMAEREGADFEQRVALKLVLGGFDSDELRDHFVTERRILAALDHPGIARLVDGGMTAEGRPWLAMELVEGTPVVEYCDARGMSVRDRLILFKRICRIVQYAHRNLVVHRDLKPANILVTPEGEPKLLDFGVAKILEEGLDPSDVTGTGRWFTPEYASPEQIRGEAVTTVSDVYALGVLLYELLTGHRPVRLAGVPPHRIATTLERTEPEPPSTAISRPPPDAEGDSASGARTPWSVSRARASSPEQLRRTLSGDLDTIVLKAIRKEPERRYGSADQLADDLRRYLVGEPVLARPDTFAYRATKFVGRNRVGVAGAALAVLSLTGGLAGTMWQASRARAEARAAEAEATRAERAAGMMVDLFRLSDPSETRGADVTAREILDRGAARVEVELADQPALQAELLAELGQIYFNLGSFERARALLERALELRVDLFGEEHRDVVSDLVTLGTVVAAQGEHELAADRLSRALDLLGRLEAAPAAVEGDARHHLAEAYRVTGRYEEAEAEYVRALELRRSDPEVADADVAESLFGLAAALHDRGRFDRSEPLFREALDIFRQHPETPHPLAIRALLNVGSVGVARAQYEEAEPLMREALALSLEVFGPEHPSTIEGETGLGTILHNTGRYDEAEPLLRGTVAKAERVLGEGHLSVIIVRQVLAMTLSALEESDESVALLEHNLELMDPGHPTEVLGHLLLSDAHLDRGAYSASRGEADEGLRIARERFGDRHPYIVLGTLQLADVDRAEGRWDDARGRYERALALAGSALSEGHRYAVRGRLGLAWYHLERGELEPAEALFGGALASKRDELPEGHPELAEPLLGLARIRVARGETGEAAPLLEEALEVRRAAYPDGHRLVREVERALEELGAPGQGPGTRDQGLGTASLAQLPPAPAEERHGSAAGVELDHVDEVGIASDHPLQECPLRQE